jgi:2-polyprenyl-6-methoxyphenol hydroxylase-like FAD-dependent oxidoreductase
VKQRALVVGAGIGGLVAGRVLRESGFDVRVLERNPTLESLGAGISLWPNATRVLRRLGVDDHLPAAGAIHPEAGLRRWDGRLLALTDPAEIERRYGAPMLLLQRSTLLHALLSGGIEDLVELDSEVVGIGEEGGRARAELAGGGTLEADLLIGADGVRSRVREGLLGDGPPRHSGLLAYRAVIPRPRGAYWQGEYWGARRVFGLVPLDGGRLYWFATDRGSTEPSNEPDPVPGLLERHRGWAPEIVETIEATPPESVLRHDLFDRKPTKRWVGGRVALLGDAAHPMLPFLGQGACQAFEDAEALGAALRGTADLPGALREYERARWRRAARIMTRSRQMGRLAHLGPAPLRVLRNRAMAMTPGPLRMRQLDVIIGRGGGALS